MNQETAPSAATRLVRVELGERAYDILIAPGLLDAAGAEISARFPGARVAVVCDETVAGLHGARLSLSLDAAGIGHETIRVPAGEPSKSYAMLQQVVEAIIAGRFERGDLVLALGGGVVGDLAGFAAAITRRGMGFVQMPTSLLAQVDSSVGGKTGINSPQGKNLVGAFHQPGLVIADTALLDTLSPREFAAGYAEVVKYGLIDRPDFFAWLEANREAVFAGGAARIEAIAVSCVAKAAVVAADEREGGQRALLNLGHTFGHALEKHAGFEAARLVHGEGVAIGMALAFRFSAALGLAPEDDARAVERHLTAAGLPTRIEDIPGAPPSVAALMAAIGQDKKVARGRLTFILARGIGQAFIARDVEPDTVSAFLGKELSA